LYTFFHSSGKLTGFLKLSILTVVCFVLVCRIRLVVDPPLIDNVTVQVSHLALSAEILVKLFHTRVPGYALNQSQKLEKL
jgi:hypothetical protein